MKTKIRELWLHHLLWGLGLGAAVIANIQILTWVGLGLTHWTWILTYVLVMVFAVLAARSLRKRLGAPPRFLKAALLIAVMILLSRLMEQTYMFIYLNYIDPTWIDTVDQIWTAQLRESGTSEETIAKYIADFRNQWQTGYIFTIGIFRYGIPQFILGLIAATVSAVQPWRKRGSDQHDAASQ